MDDSHVHVMQAVLNVLSVLKTTKYVLHTHTHKYILKHKFKEDISLEEEVTVSIGKLES